MAKSTEQFVETWRKPHEEANKPKYEASGSQSPHLIKDVRVTEHKLKPDTQISSRRVQLCPKGLRCDDATLMSFIHKLKGFLKALFPLGTAAAILHKDV